MRSVGVLIARVLPDVSGLDKQFDYLVPDHLRDQIRVGTQVRVPLNGRRVGGWVTALERSDDRSSGTVVAVERLKPVAMISGHGPDGGVIELAEWAAWRWAGPVRAVMRAASPPTMVRFLPAGRWGSATSPGDAVTAATLAEAASALGGQDVSASLGTRVMRFPPCLSRIPVIVAAAGLGPTLVVVPSVDTARIFGARLRSHGLTVAVMPDQWAAAAGGVDVVIGARHAIWATCPRITSILVLDEHDESLQEERSPTWVVRDVAIERARRLRVPCLLVSPSPSVAAVVAADVPVTSVGRIEERDGWPLVEIIDRSDEAPWKTSLISSSLIQHLRSARQVVCVINTVGRSKRLACRTCRELTVCERCTATVHELQVGQLSCVRCQTSRPRICQSCGGASLANLRPGVSRLREELEAAAGRTVVEVVAAGGDDPPPAAGVYVGTEAVLHRVRSADVVAFLDLDSELLAPRYRAAEQAMGLIVRGARLVGPRASGGRLIIQSRLVHHEVIEAARHAAPEMLLDAEIARRQSLGFPPFGALASVSGPGTAEFVRSLPPDIGTAQIDDDRSLLRAADFVHLADAIRGCPRPPDARLRIVVDPTRI